MGAWVMAGVTFREAARKKLLLMAVLAALAFLALYSTALHFQVKDVHGSALIRQEAARAFIMMGLYAVDILAVVLTALTSVDTLSGEMASGTIQAVATKPVSRRQILLGKWLGFVGMMTVYVALMVGGVVAVSYWISGLTPRHLMFGASLIWLECVLLLNLVLFLGTTFSTLTNGVLALGLHGLAFLGGWIEQVGAILHSTRAVTVGIVASIVMPSESLWRRAAFEMQSPLVGALNISPFSNASVPSRWMIGYASAYLLAFLALAVRRFGRRDL
ncbi:MAG TPA: ABC transporter permease subunit [Terriglobia bacterium]|nr:ABC transporter permease subunit [Terriglobia bacterium]